MTKSVIIELGKSQVKVEIVGAGVRYALLPPPRDPQAWDLTAEELADRKAFEEAGWRFHPATDLQWSTLKDDDRNIIEAGLLARHPDGGLLIVMNHILAEPSDADQLVHLEERARGLMRSLPSQMERDDIRVPPSGSESLYETIRREVVRFKGSSHGLDGGPNVDIALTIHLLSPGTRVGPIGDHPLTQKHWTQIQLDPNAWNEEGLHYGANIRVAVIDLGFYLDDPQIKPHIETTVYVDDQGNVGVRHVDASGNVTHRLRNGTVLANELPQAYHGTLCAGLVGALKDTLSVNGAAPACKLVPVVLQSVTRQDAVAAAITACADGFGVGLPVDVIVCSLCPSNRSWNPWSDIQTAIDYASTRGRGGLGIPIIWAVYNKKKKIPAGSLEDYAPVLCVGPSVVADSPIERMSDYGYGPGIVLAPGETITGLQWNAGQAGIGRESGSSCSAPIVAGVAALMLSAKNTLKSSQVAEILRTTCDPQPALGQTKTPVSDKVGWGRVNAFEAVKKAKVS